MKTNIQIKEETKKRLIALKRGHDTYDDVILRLIIAQAEKEGEY
jgi:predicted CopG family antitoxin